MEGLGALSSVYRLRPDYLDVLDRMEIGPVEWDLIPLLREEQSLEEVFGWTSHPDLVIARMLWAFRLVGVVERVSEVELQEREELAERERAEAEALAAEPAEAADRGVSIPVRIVETEQDASPPAFAPAEPVPDSEEEIDLAPEDDLTAPGPHEEETEVFPAPEPLVPEFDEERPSAVSPPSGDEESAVASLDTEREAEPEEFDDVSATDDGPFEETGFELAPEEDGFRVSHEVEEPAIPPPFAGEPAVLPDEGAEPVPAVPDEGSADLPVTDEAATIFLDEADEAEEFEGVGEVEDDEGFLLDEPGAVRPELWIEGEGREEAGDLPDFEIDEPGYSLEEEAEVDSVAAAPEVSEARDDEAGAEAGASGEALAATVRLTVQDLAPPPPPPPEEVVPESAGDDLEAVASGESDTGDQEAPLDEEGAQEAPAGVPPDDDLAREIRRFNERHRFLFDHLKSEIGAGARNFVATCQRRAGQSFGAMFEGLAVDPEGEYDPEGLRNNILDRNIEDYPRVFELLLETEFEMVRDLFPPDRLASIEAGLKDIGLRFES
jgi:hypothetical protein